MFEAPIPGQSLTNEPKNYPWENPSRLTTPEDALVYHLERLNQPKRIEAMLDFLQLDIDVVTMTAKNAFGTEQEFQWQCRLRRVSGDNW